MALMEVNFFSKALMRPVTMNVILPADKVFFEEETEEDNKPFKTLYLLHGVMGSKYVLHGSSGCERKLQ